MRVPGKFVRSGLGAALAALTVLFASFYYYTLTARYLPLGAGPDGPAHVNVAKFIHRYHRLPVLPADEDRLEYTPYGTTRALRPPLSYIVSAAVAWIVHNPDRSLLHDLRLGSALLCALAVTFTFLALWLLFDRFWFGLCGAFLLGLLPQFTFIASYTNDDSGAVFSATFLVFALAVVTRRGLTVPSMITVSAAAGLVILSKFTAWLLLPFAALMLLPYLWTERRHLVSYVPLGAVVMVLAGGWWLLFNTYHYGVDDILLNDISREISAKHARLPDPYDRGFSSLGISAYQLIVENYKNFVGESFKSTIGNLDWLRLRVGWLQYTFYLIVTICALIYVPLRLGTVAASGLFRQSGVSQSPGQDWRRLWLELVLIAAILFQGLMYVRFNLNYDIQVQGKYLLPVALPVLVLFFGLIDWVVGREAGAPARAGPSWISVIAVAGIVAAVIVHVNALREYVLPYYYPKPQNFNLKPFHDLELGDNSLVQSTYQAEVGFGYRQWRVTSFGVDPQIVLDPAVCRHVSVNALALIEVTATEPDTFKIYFDDGTGYSEKLMTSARFGPGENTLVMLFGARNCRGLRLDPLSKPGHVVITRIALAPLGIDAHNIPR